jgi:hypothetical protein
VSDPELTGRARRELLGEVALGLVVAAAVLPGGVLAGEGLYDRDVHAVWLAQSQALVSTIRAGSLPLWNPWIGFGEPMLANPTVQALYPPAWLLLVLPQATWYLLSTIAHLVFSGLGARRLATALGLDRTSALCAAALWMLSGPLLSLMNVWHHFAGACWMPWVLLAGDRALRERSWRAALAWGAAAGIQLLAGSPDASVMTAMASLLLLLRHRPGAAPGAWVRTIGLAAATGAALSAGQWLPSMEMALRSSRASLDPAVRTAWSLHPIALLQVWLPTFFKELPSLSEKAARPFELWSPFLDSIHLGLPTLALAAAALAWPGARWPRAVLGAFAVCVVLALGHHTPAHGLAALVVPPLRMLRYPIKFMVPAALAWALLCGAGLAAWRADLARRRHLVAAACAVAGAATAAVALPTLLQGLGVVAPGVDVAGVTAGTRAGLALAAVLGGVGLASLGWRRPPLAVVAALVCVAQLVVAHHRLNPTVNAAFFRWRPEVLAQLTPADPGEPVSVFVWDYKVRLPSGHQPHAENLRHFVDVRSPLPASVARSIAMQAYLFPPMAGRWGVRGSFDADLLGLLAPEVNRAIELVRETEGNAAHVKLLQLAGVDYVLALHPLAEGLIPVASVPSPVSVPIHVGRVPSPLPHAYAVTGARRAADGRAAVEALTAAAFDPRREIVVAGAGSDTMAAPTPGTARITSWRPDRLVIEADLPADGHVVVLEAVDPGWSATVDARSSPVVAANGLFRGVAVPAGRHEVVFVYRPRLQLLSVALSALVAVGLLAIVAWRVTSRGPRT